MSYVQLIMFGYIVVLGLVWSVVILNEQRRRLDDSSALDEFNRFSERFPDVEHLEAPVRFPLGLYTDNENLRLDLQRKLVRIRQRILRPDQ